MAGEILLAAKPKDRLATLSKIKLLTRKAKRFTGKAWKKTGNAVLLPTFLVLSAFMSFFTMNLLVETAAAADMKFASRSGKKTEMAGGFLGFGTIPEGRTFDVGNLQAGDTIFSVKRYDKIEPEKDSAFLAVFGGDSLPGATCIKSKLADGNPVEYYRSDYAVVQLIRDKKNAILSKEFKLSTEKIIDWGISPNGRLFFMTVDYVAIFGSDPGSKPYPPHPIKDLVKQLGTPETIGYVPDKKFGWHLQIRWDKGTADVLQDLWALLKVDIIKPFKKA